MLEITPPESVKHGLSATARRAWPRVALSLTLAGMGLAVLAVAIGGRVQACSGNDPLMPNHEPRYDLVHDGDLDVMDIMLVSGRWLERC